MRKKIYTRQVGVLFSENTYKELIRITDEIEIRETPFYDSLLIEDSTSPANPYGVDIGIVDRIMNSSGYWQTGQWY